MHTVGIGNRIKEERDRLGFSQITFAGVAEATRNSQLNWEKGTAFPNAAVLAAWSKIGVDVLYIVTGVRSVDIASKLTSDEDVLLNAYRAAPVSVRNSALAVLLSGGQAPEGVDTSKERKGRAAPKRVQWVENNQGGQVYGDVGTVNITSKKRDE
ncbi:helix-turn-helix domain-containing protein [Oligella urethralis]|uniref:helix-turn-helix domain-containing protein n=1 Tax=Oligella urethralis TaxID=90245 RepID=UPI00055FD058|nr:helix-turn-helix domain-containing protein [Oligella urethralis]